MLGEKGKLFRGGSSALAAAANQTEEILRDTRNDILTTAATAGIPGTLFGKPIVADAMVGGKVAQGGLAVGRVSDDTAHNAATFERYKDELRAVMGKPNVTDAELARYMDELYRANAKIGSGSTAAAVRHELATGSTVGGVTHSQKAQDMITALQRWLKNNPNASRCDRDAAANVIKEMQNALEGN